MGVDRSARDLTRYSTDAAAPTRNAAPEIMAPSTWITSQYECSAGTSGPGGTNTSADRPSTTVPKPVMIGPSQSIAQIRTSTMYAVRAASVAAQPNSYMLPHGTRSADRPRATTPASSTSQARLVSEKPIPPAMSLRSASGASSSTGTDAAPTSARSGATLRAKPHCATYATNASARMTVADATA